MSMVRFEVRCLHCESFNIGEYDNHNGEIAVYLTALPDLEEIADVRRHPVAAKTGRVPGHFFPLPLWITQSHPEDAAISGKSRSCLARENYAGRFVSKTRHHGTS